MVLVFRFVLAVLAAMFFRRRIDPLEASELRFLALPTDCDLNLHLNAGRTISFMDLGRVELIARTGALRPILARKWRPIAGGALIRYRRSVLPFRRFTVRTRIACWDAKWFYLEHVVESGGKLCTVGIVRALFRGESGSIATSEVMALLGMESRPSPPMPDDIARWRDLEDAR